jgi:hypothetical protein
MSNIKFAVVVGNEVAGTIALPDDPEVEVAQRFIAAYRSNPVIVETTEEGVAYGWTWDGTNFIAPSEQQ